MAQPEAIYRLMDQYMINRNNQNFDSIFDQIRIDELDPPDLIFYAVRKTNKRVVEGLFDIARKNGFNLVNMANGTYGGYGDTVLSDALTNENRQASEEIIRVLLKNGANPNKEADGLHFYWHIKEAEQDFPDDRDYMAFLQRVRDMLNEFQFNCPDVYQRFRRAGQAPRGIGKKKQTKKNKKQKQRKKTGSLKNSVKKMSRRNSKKNKSSRT